MISGENSGVKNRLSTFEEQSKFNHAQYLSSAARSGVKRSDEYGLGQSGSFKIKSLKKRGSVGKSGSRERTKLTNIKLKHGFHDKVIRPASRNNHSNSYLDRRGEQSSPERNKNPKTEKVSLRSSTNVIGSKRRPMTSSVEFSSGTIRVRRVKVANKGISSALARSPEKMSNKNLTGTIKRHLEEN